MPAKNATKRPQHVIDEAVKRFMAGESAHVLAKYYKVSRPGLYNWVHKYKLESLANAERKDMSPDQLKQIDRQQLVAENMALKEENSKLRHKVVALMIKAGDI
jgi:transposase